MDGGSERHTICYPFARRHLALKILILAKTNVSDQKIIDTIGFDDIELTILTGALDFGIGITWKQFR